MSSLFVHSVILDAEIVRLGEDGLPDFHSLMRNDAGDACAYYFDVLELDGKDMRRLPLIKRKVALEAHLMEASNPHLRYSDNLSDPERLLAVAEQIGL